jgi:hypothetical protein
VRVLEREAARMSDASGTWLWGVFRPAAIRHHAYACKLVGQWVSDGDNALLPGMPLLSPFFRGQFPDEQPEARFQVSRAIAGGAWEAAFAGGEPSR